MQRDFSWNSSAAAQLEIEMLNEIVSPPHLTPYIIFSHTSESEKRWWSQISHCASSPEPNGKRGKSTDENYGNYTRISYRRKYKKETRELDCCSLAVVWESESVSEEMSRSDRVSHFVRVQSKTVRFEHWSCKLKKITQIYNPFNISSLCRPSVNRWSAQTVCVYGPSLQEIEKSWWHFFHLRNIFL